MDINRIQIEGGFLDGIDIPFSPGLNVLIGARGTGKTSVIELIRYALGAKSLTVESKKRSLEHAREVLKDGEVTITMSDLLDDVIVSRSSGEEEPRVSSDFVMPIILSQTEIETVGLSDSGRLGLIDGFITDRNSMRNEQAAITSSVKSIYKEIGALEGELSSLSEGVEQYESIAKKISVLEQEQKQYQGATDDVVAKQVQLSALSVHASNLAVQEDVLVRFNAVAEDWFLTLEDRLFEDFGLEAWDDGAGLDPLSDLRPQYVDAIKELDGVLNKFDVMRKRASEKVDKVRADQFESEKQSRALRSELEKNAEGAGALARQINILKANTAQIQSRQKLLAERRNRLLSLRARRDEKLNELAALQDRKSSLRQEIIDRINLSLSPHIRVELERAAQYIEYTREIADALRGSGMKYNELAVNLSGKISPRELMGFVDDYDYITLSEITGIPVDRAARLLTHLNESGVAGVVTCEIEDSIKLSLLDGTSYKDVASLSAGQRCTVILSIVLQHRERTLIIDQPEDHLDNAFIASTIIKALLERRKSGQVILSTHNANIPVLGEADLIVEMTSDGRNGYVQVCKPLNDDEAVDAITNVMEGGKKAFQSRAAFYKSHEF